MERKLFHGDLRPIDVAKGLLADFDRGNLRAQILGEGEDVAVQITTRPGSRSGGTTALTISIRAAPDGVWVQPGSHEWLGTAASLGATTMAALLNPWNLVHRLDDIAQDVENMQLMDRVWASIDRATRLLGANLQLSDKLRRHVCEYCGTGNPVGEGSCLACGAPMGTSQPGTCPNCGYLVSVGEARCPNCGKDMSLARPAHT